MDFRRAGGEFVEGFSLTVGVEDVDGLPQGGRGVCGGLFPHSGRGGCGWTPAERKSMMCVLSRMVKGKNSVTFLAL